MTASADPAHRTVDLHLHTHYSDGTYTPAQVVEAAAQHGLSTIAITDHDTLASQPEAQTAAAAAGLELIPGIELSTQEGASHDVHLLAYYVDVQDAALRAWLDELQAARLRRLTQMLERLQSLGVALTLADVAAVAGRGSVGRLHVARALVARGLVSHTNVAFDRYLGDGKPAYIAEDKPTPEEAIRRVRAARGVPVLAHPMYIKDDAIITRLTAAGLAGLEAYHASHDVSVQRHYQALATEHGLVATGGSDCHGMAKGQPLMGTVQLPYTIVEELRACHARLYT